MYTQYKLGPYKLGPCHSKSRLKPGAFRSRQA
jgi:hypothetical protein